MPRRKESDEEPPVTRRSQATTPAGRENQMISYAIDLAERQLREGTASAQVIVHYLKLGSSREELEQDRLREENALLRAKTGAIEDQQEIIKMYEEAQEAMRLYSGQAPLRTYDD